MKRVRGAEPLGLPALAPEDGCYPVALHNQAGIVQIPDLAHGETLDFGMDVYWTGAAQDGRTYDYGLEYKRVDGDGVDVTYSAGSGPNENTWKSAGWSVVGMYAMPFQFTAVRAN